MQDNAEQAGSGPDREPPGRVQSTDPAPLPPSEDEDNGGDTLFGINAEGKFHYLPHSLAQHLGIAEDLEDVKVVDPRFARYSHSYLAQAGLAVVAMLIILLFMKSLSDAALAAALGSSLVILFVHPSSNAAKPRSLIGGHGFGLLVGVGALLIFLSPIGNFIEESRVLFDLTLAVSVGVLILIMAITDTEHPPAAGTVLGVAMQPWDPIRLGVIVGAIVLLALLKWVLQSRLRDLI